MTQKFTERQFNPYVIAFQESAARHELDTESSKQINTTVRSKCVILVRSVHLNLIHQQNHNAKFRHFSKIIFSKMLNTPVTQRYEAYELTLHHSERNAQAGLTHGAIISDPQLHNTVA